MDPNDPKTPQIPGVYVEELSAFSSSITGVASAVPAFIGHTENAAGSIQRISNMNDYKAIFGGPPPLSISIEDGNMTLAPENPVFLLYDCLRLYFLNGGGPCYIVSAGDNKSATLEHNTFRAALEKLEQEDEPTLILIPDAVNLPTDDYYKLCQEILNQCHKLGDRFAIFDVPTAKATTEQTSASPPTPEQAAAQAREAAKAATKAFQQRIGNNQDNLKYGAAYHPFLQTTLTPEYDEAKLNVHLNGKESTLASLRIEGENLKIHHEIKMLLAKQRLVLPPSAAIAGVYVSVDRNHGVWKAPANVSLNGVDGPTIKITDEDQESLNMPDNGRAINAIRAFPGRGTLVWGARTLACNSNEWRYISVRRLFNMIEESARKGTQIAVFEPNNATTWQKVKGMIEGYLYGLWQQGAFAGAKPEDAYFVHVGLGQTMTTQDVLEGRMIVNIGIAAMRPAEFIISSFFHQLPTN